MRNFAVYQVGVVEALGLQVVHEGDPVIAMKKGVNFLDQKSQVHATGRVEEFRLRGVNVQRLFGSGGL